MAWTSAALRTGQAAPTRPGCCEPQRVSCELCLCVQEDCAAPCSEHSLHCSKAKTVTANLPSSLMLLLCPGCSGFGKRMPGWQEEMKSSSSKSRGRRWNFMSVESSLRRSDWGNNSYIQYVSQGRSDTGGWLFLSHNLPFDLRVVPSLLVVKVPFCYDWIRMPSFVRSFGEKNIISNLQIISFISITAIFLLSKASHLYKRHHCWVSLPGVTLKYTCFHCTERKRVVFLHSRTQ